MDLLRLQNLKEDKELEKQYKSPLLDPTCWMKDPQPSIHKWIPFEEDIKREKTKRERREHFELKRLNAVTHSDEEKDSAPKDPQVQT